MLRVKLSSLFLLLCVSILLIVSVSCAHVVHSTPNDKDTIQTEKEQQTNENESKDTVAESTDAVTDNTDTEAGDTATDNSVTEAGEIQSENNGIIHLYAPTFFQDVLSWMYSLDIMIEDNKIYINDRLYEKSSSEPPEIVYPDGFFPRASHYDERNNTEIATTLEIIRDSEPCCVLETDEECSTGKLLSVYEIEGSYYFVRFNDNGLVMRIHSVTIESEEMTLPT